MWPSYWLKATKTGIKVWNQCSLSWNTVWKILLSWPSRKKPILEFWAQTAGGFNMLNKQEQTRLIAYTPLIFYKSKILLLPVWNWFRRSKSGKVSSTNMAGRACVGDSKMVETGVQSAGFSLISVFTSSRAMTLDRLPAYTGIREWPRVIICRRQNQINSQQKPHQQKHFKK